MSDTYFNRATRRALILLWLAAVGLFAVVQIVRISRGDQTGMGFAGELVLLTGVVIAAVVTGHSIGQRRFGRAALAFAVLLVIDFGSSLVLGLRAQPFLFPTTGSAGATLVVLLIGFAIAPYVRNGQRDLLPPLR